jgi:hypothetical protein
MGHTNLRALVEWGVIVVIVVVLGLIVWLVWQIV